MASYFYLYLYTDSPPCRTEEIETYVTKTTEYVKGIKRMSIIENGFNNLTIDEATSHWIKAIVMCGEDTADLTGCHAIFTMAGLNKECLITDNEVTVKLEAAETQGFLSSGYQIRVFDADDDIFQIIQGIIYIRKAHRPYITNPLGGE